MSEPDPQREITAVLVRYATGIDCRDWPLFRTCFIEDCHLDYGDIGVWDGVDAVVEFMVAAHAGAGHTMHRMTNMAVDVHGEEAEARTYVDALILSPDDQAGVNAIGFYDDRFLHTPDGWRIARRDFTAVRLLSVGPA